MPRNAIKESKPGYEVLMRRMRPKSWGEVVGQPSIVRRLKNMIIKGTVPHTILMEGDRGLGKTTCARLLAARVNCQEADPKSADPCGECASCRGILWGQSTMMIQEINCGERNKVEDIAGIIERSQYSSGDHKRVFIFDEFHHVTGAAKTSLLKPLEEPNDNVIWILCTTESNKVMPTIRSRCVTFRFRPMSEGSLMVWISTLLEGIVADDTTDFERFESKAALRIARLADGSAREALALIEGIVQYGGEEITATIVDDISGVSPYEALDSYVKMILDGDMMKAHSLGREVYTDSFLHDLVTYLYTQLIPRSGAIMTVKRKAAHRLLRAALNFRPEYSHTVNRDGLLFVLYDAVHGDQAPIIHDTKSSSSNETDSSDDDRAARISRAVNKTIKKIQDDGPVDVDQKWDGKIAILVMGKNKTRVAICSKNSIPEDVKYYIPSKGKILKAIRDMEKFSPKDAIAQEIMIKA